jgi:uncharacterized protein with PIN domain/sulfur carrier protein ThiS
MSCRVEARFYAELNDFLAPERRGRPITLDVAAGTTVKDLVESLGAPHTEVDVILVNGESVGFGHQVADGDRVSVYPVFEAFDVSPLVRLRPGPLREPRFVLDVHLGRLARALRLLGFDALWRNDTTDEELAGISVEQNRILLTRDRGVLKRAAVTRGYFVRATDRRRQVVEVLERFDLFGAIAPFARCLECNGVLEAVAKEEIEHRLPPRTRRDYHDFRRCPDCGRVYWQGSHYDRLAALVEDVRRSGATPAGG